MNDLDRLFIKTMATAAVAFVVISVICLALFVTFEVR
jgi:hypothetical protein